MPDISYKPEPPPVDDLNGFPAASTCIRSETVEYVTGQGVGDLGNANRLVMMHGADLHWARERNAWFVWDGTRWVVDKTGEAERRAQATARSILMEAYSEPDKAEAKRLSQLAITSLNRGKLEAMLEIAKSQPGITIPLTQFDNNPFKLNFLNGTLDLETGYLHPHNPLDLISKQIQINYDPYAECPLWLRFLDDIFDHDQEMTAYIRRCVGYCLTGDTSEKCLFVGYGTGDNGKTVFNRTIQGTLGEDYAINARAETILALDRSGGGATPDLARLRGARFVAVNEIPSHKRLDEARVKEMTGMDEITARFLFADEITFIPEYKLWISTNHMPQIHDQDNAIWNRLRKIPFDVTFQKDEQDTKLIYKLKAEWPGIIEWAVKGCLEWQAGGLQTPDKVSKATAEYRKDEDVLLPFFEEKCTFGPDAKIGATDLYKTYKTWCEETEERAASQTRFGRLLIERGFKKEHAVSGAVYSGIEVKP